MMWGIIPRWHKVNVDGFCFVQAVIWIFIFQRGLQPSTKWQQTTAVLKGLLRVVFTKIHCLRDNAVQCSVKDSMNGSNQRIKEAVNNHTSYIFLNQKV
jgi:hypothetical protein